MPHLMLCLTTPNPHISLSASPREPVLFLTVRARRTDKSPLTLCTVGGVLDNGRHTRHDGVFKGAFLPLSSISDPSRKIQLHFPGFPNYGSQPNASSNLLERDDLRFETVPGKDGNDLTNTHEISLERLFRYSELHQGSVKVGEKFVVKMNPKKLGSVEGWWTWGDLESDLNGKKFARWELPDNQGDIGNLMPGEKVPDVEGMQKEGWVFSEPFDDLKIEVEEREDVVIEFVE